MEISSLIRRSLSRNSSKRDKNPDQSNHEEQNLGVTEELIGFCKSLTFDTFKNFPLPDNDGIVYGDDSPTTSSNVRKDLSEWQERHAMVVLSKVKEISQLRYMLCPRHLKEKEFWRIYFMLVWSHVAEYELRAIRLAKLKRMSVENEKSLDIATCEVEMAEANQATGLVPSTP